MKDTIKVIVKRVGEEPVEEEVRNRLGALQDLVGGYLESITIASDACLLVDEEGLLRGKLYNCHSAGMPLFGTVVLIGVDGDEFTDAPGMELVKSIGLFRRR